MLRLDRMECSPQDRQLLVSLQPPKSLGGFTPERDYAYLEINRLLRRLHPEIIQRTEAEIVALGGQVERDPATDLLRINDEFTVSIVLARRRETATGGARWKLRMDTTLPRLPARPRSTTPMCGVSCCCWTRGRGAGRLTLPRRRLGLAADRFDLR